MDVCWEPRSRSLLACPQPRLWATLVVVPALALFLVTFTGVVRAAPRVGVLCRTQFPEWMLVQGPFALVVLGRFPLEMQDASVCPDDLVPTGGPPVCELADPRVWRWAWWVPVPEPQGAAVAHIWVAEGPRSRPEMDRMPGPQFQPWSAPRSGRGSVGAQRPRTRTLSINLSPLDTQECTLKVQDGKFKLQDLLVVPMQRVLKYHLLLKVGLRQPPGARAARMHGRGVYAGRRLSPSVLGAHKSCSLCEGLLRVPAGHVSQKLIVRISESRKRGSRRPERETPGVDVCASELPGGRGNRTTSFSQTGLGGGGFREVLT